jgi:heme O synthase-like polyprenyltransferase
MSALAAVSLLVFYPLLTNLPLNLVRFQWGFKRGLAPMSPDVQKQAEAADRMVLYVSYFILLAVVVALLNRSQFSVYAVGLTIGNWKSAIALGALSSLLFVSLESIIPAEKLR